MAFSEDLADRVRAEVAGAPNVVEKQMFGGLSFLVHGNMAVGVHGDEMIVRLDKDDTDEALSQPGTRIFDFTGRPMQGWIMVGEAGYSSEQDFKQWVKRGMDYALSLPAK